MPKIKKDMKRFLIKVFLFFILFFSFIKISENITFKIDERYILISDNVWGSIYNPVIEQCNNDPTITGDGSKINIEKASELRWVAISQDMLYCIYRQKLINDSTDNRYKGKIKYGDTIWIDSPYNNINGIWIVHDTKNKRYSGSIDFLQTLNDGSLYDNNPLWSGKFENIKIYKYNKNLINNLS